MQGSRTSHESEGRDHADQAETMVAVQMGDKHMTQFGESDLAAPQLHLRAFRAIEHK